MSCLRNNFSKTHLNEVSLENPVIPLTCKLRKGFKGLKNKKTAKVPVCLPGLPLLTKDAAMRVLERLQLFGNQNYHLK